MLRVSHRIAEESGMASDSFMSTRTASSRDRRLPTARACNRRDENPAAAPGGWTSTGFDCGIFGWGRRDEERFPSQGTGVFPFRGSQSSLGPEKKSASRAVEISITGGSQGRGNDPSVFRLSNGTEPGYSGNTSSRDLSRLVPLLYFLRGTTGGRADRLLIMWMNGPACRWNPASNRNEKGPLSHPRFVIRCRGDRILGHTLLRLLSKKPFR